MHQSFPLILGFVLALLSSSVLGQDCLELVGRHPLGVNTGLASDGSFVYMANGASMMVVDLSNPEAPEEVGRLDLPFRIAELVSTGNRVYAMADGEVVYAIDVTDPSAPTELGKWAYSGIQEHTTRGLGAAGDTLIVIRERLSWWGPGPRHLDIVDFVDPSAPLQVGQWSTGAAILDVSMVGSYALVATGDELVVIDIVALSRPTQIGAIECSAYSVVGAGTKAFVGGVDVFSVVDVSTPDNPIILGQEGFSGYAFRVAVSGDRAYFASPPLPGDDIYLAYVVDVGDPVAPVVTGSLPIDRDYGQVAAVPDHGLFATASGGVRVIRATDPANPQEIARIDAPGYSLDASHAGNVLAIAAGYRGLRLVDVSEPAAPEELSILALDDYTRSVDFDGQFVYAGTHDFWVIDVTDPSAPVAASQVSIDDTGYELVVDIEVVNGIAYVGTTDYISDSGLTIVDVSVPAMPVVVSELSRSGSLMGIDVVGDLAVFASRRSGGSHIGIIDVSNSYDPNLVGWWTSGASDPAVALWGSWLLSEDIRGDPPVCTLLVHDIRDPANPVEVSSVALRNNWGINDIRISGSVAYLEVERYDYETSIHKVVGVLALNIGVPSAPTFMGAVEYEVEFSATGLTMGDENIFVTRRQSGFDTFALCQGPIFDDDFETGDTTAWSSTVP